MSGLQAVQGDLVDLRSLLTLKQRRSIPLLAPLVWIPPSPTPAWLPHCQLAGLKLWGIPCSASQVQDDSCVGDSSVLLRTYRLFYKHS